MGFKTYAKASAGVSAGGGVPAGGPAATATGWHPTVVYLGGLLLAEVVLVGFLSHWLLKGD